MRALVTGASGFVGSYLMRTLADEGYDVIPASGPADSNYALRIDLADFDSVKHAVESADADVIFHLAGQAFVPYSLERPLETFRINALGTMHLLEAVRTRGKRARAPRVVLASSASVYGKVADWSNPLREDYPIRPVDPYGASKAAAECCCLAAYRSHGIDTVIARSFNAIGPGQDHRFVASSFAAQLARIKLKIEQPIMYVGNIVTERDFLHVSDVVRAYVALAENGTSGEIYNICSGAPVRIQDILRTLIHIAGVPVEVREDPAKLRDADTRQFYGDNTRLRGLGWSPEVTLEPALRQIFAAELAANSAPEVGDPVDRST